MKYCIVLVCLFSLLARAEFTIEINEGFNKATPIAVVPFRLETNRIADKDMVAIIENNLRLSGFFKVMDRNNMLSLPGPGGKIHFSDWRVSGMDYIVVGALNEENNQFSVHYELHDVISGSKLLDDTILDTDLRDLAHRVSNALFEKVTGLKGIFDTQILYVGDYIDKETNTLKYQLMVSDQDGARTKPVVISDTPLMSPRWSPDSKQVAYVSFETGFPQIYIQELATAKRKLIASFTGINGSPEWSPDGRRMLMVLSKDGNPEIYIKDIETGELSRITNHFAIDTEPNWAPDGQSIIFTSDRGGQPQIYKIRLDDLDKIERLTFLGDYNAHSQLSVDGRYLVMVHGVGDQFHIAVRNLKTDHFSMISTTTQDESPSISPNGAMVIYATKVNNKGVLSIVSLDAGNHNYLPGSDMNIREPRWSPYPIED